VRIYLASSALLVSVLWSGCATAQSSERPGDVQLRNDCRLASQVIRTGQPAPKRVWAMSFIRICPLDGPSVLAPIWLSNTLRAGDVEPILNASSGIRDARLAEAAVTTIRAADRDPEVRIAAMILLVRYIDPFYGLAIPLLRQPSGWTRGQRLRPIPGGRGSHPISQGDGEQPLPSDLKASTISLFREISANDLNPRIQYVAGALALSLGGSLDPVSAQH
jgi:hypothetical protein